MPRPTRTALLAGGALVALVVVGYGASYALSGDRIPRGVKVGAVDLSGDTRAQAIARVAQSFSGPASSSLALVAGPDVLTLPVAGSGLAVDADKTVDQALSAGPFDRLRSLFGATRVLTPVLSVDETRLKGRLAEVAKRYDRPVREGTVHFDGVTPVAVLPQAGRALDVDGAAKAVRAVFPLSLRVEVPARTTAAKTTEEGVNRALETVAKPAVSAPISFSVAGKKLVVQPADLARALSFTADPSGALSGVVDKAKLVSSLGDRVDTAQQPPVDATFNVSSGTPVVIPGKAGKILNEDQLVSSVATFMKVAAPRNGTLSLTSAAPRVTTELARTLGVKQIIGTFTTAHPCCRPRVQNIHTIADIVDGYVVLPGETFSLNDVVGKRDSGRGFVQAPQILNGQFVLDVGGGISQFATTIFNAVFFSGLKDVQHQPHSYYISRYPPGRESTVSFPQPDFRFQNDAPTGVLVKTSYTGTSITVTFWGTKRYDVESISGPRTRPTAFQTQYITRDDCISGSGEGGFDIVVTRVFRQGGTEVKREDFRTRYLPEPRFICGPPPRPAPLPSASPTQPSSGAARPPSPPSSAAPKPAPSAKPAG